MSTIAYFAAVALIGTGAAVTSQVVTVVDAPVETRVDVSAPASMTSSAYDFDKFAADVISPIGTDKASGKQAMNVQLLTPVRVAAIGQSQLRMIVRDSALAEKADSLAAAADNQAAGVSSVDDESFMVTGEDVTIPKFGNTTIVPLPKQRPSYHALQTEPRAKRKSSRKSAKGTKRSLRRPVRVAEANTTKQGRLARRLRKKGWLIGAFR